MRKTNPLTWHFQGIRFTYIGIINHPQPPTTTHDHPQYVKKSKKLMKIDENS